MDEKDTLERIASILEVIRQNQTLQLERQAEALSLQRDQYQVVVRQQVKASKLQDRAEAIQDKSARLVTKIQRVVPLAILILFALLAYISWLLFRYYR